MTTGLVPISIGEQGSGKDIVVEHIIKLMFMMDADLAQKYGFLSTDLWAIHDSAQMNDIFNADQLNKLVLHFQECKLSGQALEDFKKKVTGAEVRGRPFGATSYGFVRYRCF